MNKNDLTIYLKYSQTPKLQQYNNEGVISTIESAERLFNYYLENNTTHKSYIFYIMLNGQETCVGYGSIYQTDSLDSISLSFFVFPEFQGKGYGTKIIQYFINIIKKLKTTDQNFKKIKKIESLVHKDNIASFSVFFKKLKFKCDQKVYYARGIPTYKLFLNI